MKLNKRLLGVLAGVVIGGSLIGCTKEEPKEEWQGYSPEEFLREYGGEDYTPAIDSEMNDYYNQLEKWRTGTEDIINSLVDGYENGFKDTTEEELSKELNELNHTYNKVAVNFNAIEKYFRSTDKSDRVEYLINNVNLGFVRVRSEAQSIIESKKEEQKDIEEASEENNTKEVEEIEYNETSEETEEESNCLYIAQTYVENEYCSKQDLIKELRSLGYNEDLINYAVENVIVDYKDQCYQKAVEYNNCNLLTFDEADIIDQLNYHEFTKEEIEYAMTKLQDYNSFNY